jgi:hypothetical protein
MASDMLLDLPSGYFRASSCLACIMMLVMDEQAVPNTHGKTVCLFRKSQVQQSTLLYLSAENEVRR